MLHCVMLVLLFAGLCLHVTQLGGVCGPVIGIYSTYSMYGKRDFREMSFFFNLRSFNEFKQTRTKCFDIIAF